MIQGPLRVLEVSFKGSKGKGAFVAPFGVRHFGLSVILNANVHLKP